MIEVFIEKVDSTEILFRTNIRSIRVTFRRNEPLVNFVFEMI